MTMQDFDVNMEDVEAIDARSARLEQFRQVFLHLFKRVLVFVVFGPGVLGVLWLIGRLFKR